MNLTVKLEIYEGPLDLLLHLIRKNEVDIYDIPIALITGQYLDYLELMESMNMEIAGEFLLMAATLTQIKSRMLLPSVNEEEASEEEDPRMAIVRPLLEHIRLKEAAEILERRTILNRDVFARPFDLEDVQEENGDGEVVKANLFDLVDAFRKIVRRFDNKTGLRVVIETKTIRQRIIEIIHLLKEAKEASFQKICLTDRNKAELVLSFLALLELARVGYIKLYQNQRSKELFIYFVERDDVADDESLSGLKDALADYKG